MSRIPPKIKVILFLTTLFVTTCSSPGWTQNRMLESVRVEEVPSAPNTGFQSIIGGLLRGDIHALERKIQVCVTPLGSAIGAAKSCTPVCAPGNACDAQFESPIAVDPKSPAIYIDVLDIESPITQQSLLSRDETDPYRCVNTTCDYDTPAGPVKLRLYMSENLVTPPGSPSWRRTTPGCDMSSLPPGISPDNYSPRKFGWHDYRVTNMVASDSLHVSVDLIRDYLRRYAVPGEDPSQPVKDGDISWVSDPRIEIDPLFQRGIPAGKVRTEISKDGLTISNTTLPAHVFYDGRIVRSACQGPDDTWYVTTRGYGNNVLPGANVINESQGPKIFTEVDKRMREGILQHFGVNYSPPE